MSLRDKIIKLWNKGHREVWIAAHLGKHPTTVGRHLDAAARAGVKLRVKYYKLSKATSRAIKHPSKVSYAPSATFVPMTVLQRAMVGLILRQPGKCLSAQEAQGWHWNTVAGLEALGCVRWKQVSGRWKLYLTDRGQYASHQYAPVEVMLAD